MELRFQPSPFDGDVNVNADIYKAIYFFHTSDFAVVSISSWALFICDMMQEEVRTFFMKNKIGFLWRVWALESITCHVCS